MNEKARGKGWMIIYYQVVKVYICMYSLVNNEMNGSKKKMNYRSSK